jgi:hypothetical protein
VFSAGTSIRILGADDNLHYVVQRKRLFWQPDNSPLFWSAIASTLNGQSVYVGLDKGEWGGGLDRVDMRTGLIAHIEHRDSNRLCAGPLNRVCDVVSAMIPDSRNKDCVLASVGGGLRDKGRIVRVCGETVSVVFERTETRTYAAGTVTYAILFDQLAGANDGSFWALADNVIYHVGPGATKEYPLPELKPVAGIYLSREVPGIIVVRARPGKTSTDSVPPLMIPLEQ